MLVPAHAVEDVFKRFAWHAPAGLTRGTSRSRVVPVKLGDEVEAWCDENNIVATGYYDYYSQRHQIVVYGSPQAMLFKLRWL